MALPRREGVDTIEAFDEIKKESPGAIRDFFVYRHKPADLSPEVHKDLYFCIEK